MCVVGMKEKQKMGMNVWVSKNGNEYMSVVGMKVQQLNGNKIINVVGMNGSLTEGYQCMRVVGMNKTGNDWSCEYYKRR